jgi:hypothetical protein
MTNLVFISHSHSDQNAASALIDLLFSALELEEREVRCTSVPGHQLPFGKTISQQLKGDINTSTAIIALLSKESIRSPWVLFELGASWALGKIIVPILGSEVIRDQLPGPLAEYPYIQVDSRDASSRLTDAITQIAETLDLKERTGGRRQKKLTDFVNAFRVLHPPAGPVVTPKTNIPDVGEILTVTRCEEWEDKLNQLLEEASSSTPPSSPPIQVNIKFPANKGKAPEFITMTGTVTGDVKNAHLWVVGREENQLFYFPQGEEIYPTTNGDWSSSGVRIGAGQSGVGKHHELKVIQANEIMHEAFQLYFKIGRSCGKWPPFMHIHGTKELATITVVRR